jgi:capsular polysaccharide export protein
MSAHHHSYKKIGVFSRAIAKIADIETLLEAKLITRRFGRFKEPIEAIAGWGHKATADKAREYARKHTLPYLALEDGFLRSIELGHDAPPLSIIVDDLGVYYDANHPSRLEELAKAPLTEAQTVRAQQLIESWRTARVSKYNHLREPDQQVHNWPSKPYVLVVDQTLGDASISLGRADAACFEQMLASALSDHPDKTVLIKAHPEVMAGHKKGHFDLEKVCEHPSVEIWAHDTHPVALLEHAHAVYTVTSQLGFEGLLWGKPVHTFGMPFYAGWGLTHDLLPGPEQDGQPRRKNIALTQLAHAALVDYPRYVNPVTQQRCEIEELIHWLVEQRTLRQRFAPVVYGLGFSWNKRPSVRRFLSGSQVHFVRSEDQVPALATLAVWGSCEVKRTDLTVLRLEDGFIRSVGLGADLIRPLSWVVDTQGIYYDASRPSELEQLLQEFEPSSELLSRAKALRASITEAGVTKYNLPGQRWYRPSTAQKVILVIGQVESDASIAKGAHQIKTNIDLLRTVRQANPNAFIVYKPHPDVTAKLRRPGTEEHRAKLFCNATIIDIALQSLLDKVEEVHVMTSLTGFEALLRGCTVHTYGAPFYAGWGLTIDHAPHPHRTKKRSLDELVAAALIVYPRYLIPKTGYFGTPESTLAIVQQQSQRQSLITRTFRKALRLIVRLTSKPR